MKLREALSVLQVSFSACALDSKPHHWVLGFKPTNALEPLFCQGRAAQRVSGQVCLMQGQEGWPGGPWNRRLGTKGTVAPRPAISGHTTRCLPARVQS